MVRIFLAIPLPAEERRALGRIARAIPFGGKGLRPVKAENIHITLKFIGDCPEARISLLSDACRRAAAQLSSFSLTLKGTGVFPTPLRPRVMWAGLAGDLDRLRRLFNAVEDGLHPLGFPRDSREFRPHVTLARIKGRVPPEVVTSFLQTPLHRSPFVVDRFSLFSSTLRPQGPIYQELESFPLQ